MIRESEAVTEPLVAAAPSGAAPDRLLLPTVFLTGAATLIIEILGTRLMSPYFGNNVYVWTALIGVTLVALAAGYWIGGRLADARGKPGVIDLLVAGAALWAALIPPLVKTLSPPFVIWNYRAGVLSVALAAFGPALLLIGSVTPVAVKLAVSNLSTVGRSAGAVYAWSTMGGIAGALTAGFLLFPNVSVTTVCRVTAVALAVLAGVRLVERRKGLVPALTLGALLFASASSSGWMEPARAQSAGGYEILASLPSFYGPIRVADRGDVRYLLIDGLCHNAQSISTGAPVMPHIPLFAALPNFRPKAQTALLLGLGGGDMVHILNAYGVRTTAVEIDPKVAWVARRYFGISEQNCEIVIGDGRLFLRRASGRYDFVIFDAFLGGKAPAHLLSREALQEARARMRPDGVVAVNLVVNGRDSPVVCDMAATLQSVFPHLLAVSTGSGRTLLNVVLFASAAPLDLPETWTSPPQILGALESFPGLIFAPCVEDGRIVTDEFNRLEAESVEIEVALRIDSLRHLPASLIVP